MWKPGQSGNPGGRPRSVKELAEKSREYTDAVYAQFEEMLKNPHTRDETRLAICRELLDRAYGRPTQDIGLHGSEEKPPIKHDVKLTAAEMRAVVEAGKKLDADV